MTALAQVGPETEKLLLFPEMKRTSERCKGAKRVDTSRFVGLPRPRQMFILKQVERELLPDSIRLSPSDFGLHKYRRDDKARGKIAVVIDPISNRWRLKSHQALGSCLTK